MDRIRTKLEIIKERCNLDYIKGYITLRRKVYSKKHNDKM